MSVSAYSRPILFFDRQLTKLLTGKEQSRLSLAKSVIDDDLREAKLQVRGADRGLWATTGRLRAYALGVWQLCVFAGFCPFLLGGSFFEPLL